MRVIVTGGAGFIGSHLSERLVREGADLTIVDDLNDSYAQDLKWANLRDVERVGNFDFHQLDITDQASINGLFESTGADLVIHLAARAGVRPSLKDPLLYERVNVQGTLVLLEACRRYSVKKIVFASSSSVYGCSPTVPFSEEDSRLVPISPYAATKIAGEQMCQIYSRLYGMRVICLRLFTVYGPRQRPDLAIRKFVERIESGQPIPFFGDGCTRRDYTYISDIVDGICASLDYDSPWEVFNLGNSHPVTLNEMLATVEAALGKKAQILRLPHQSGDVPITCADTQKARRELDFQPKVSFRKGVGRFVQWHQGQL
jgi:UDP-glucuronate 4-epimerase